MNIVYNKNSLRVVSLLDSVCVNNSGEIMLRKMFPYSFQNFSIWNINKSFNFNPIHLRVELDEEKHPDILFFKNKAIYRLSEEEKRRIEAQKIEDGKKVLSSFLPRTLRSYLGTDIVKMWVDFPYTLPGIRSSLKNYQYFSDGLISPVIWSGPFMDAGGYANMNREISFRLHNHHILAKAEVWPTAPQISDLSRFYVSKYAFDIRRVKNPPKIHSFTPHPVTSHRGRVIFFTMMETETLHPEFVRLCNKYSDEIWVPSSHNQNVFREHGIKKPIYLMPLGINDHLYANQSDLGVINDSSCFVNLLGRPITSGINKFRFITLFGWSYRKGTDILIKSFVKEFNDADDVALIICSRFNGSPSSQFQDVIKGDVLRYARQVRGGNYPQIILLPHIIPENHMPSIYRMGNAFVHFSRGEGFSLPQIEAAAAGLPVISCNNTGMSEYLSDDNSYLVKTNEKEVGSQEMHWITTFYHGQLFPKIGEDQIEQARKHMRFVLCNYSLAKIKANVFRNQVFSKYTWDLAAERVAKRLKEICKNA